MEFIELRGGLMAQPADIALLCDLEDRGMTFAVDGEALRIRGANGQKPELSPGEVSQIKTRKAHLMALVAYDAAATANAPQ